MPVSNEYPAAIVCMEKETNVQEAIVFADGSIRFSFQDKDYNPGTLDNIFFVKNNFWFLYENLLYNQQNKNNGSNI